MIGYIQANAQYVLSTASDSVQIYTQWGREKKFKKSSAKVLLMRIENSNPFNVAVSYEVDFIDDLKVVETSKAQLISIRAAKGERNGIAKLKFKPANYNPEEIDGVDIEILKVENTGDMMKAKAKF